MSCASLTAVEQVSWLEKILFLIRCQLCSKTQPSFNYFIPISLKNNLQNNHPPKKILHRYLWLVSGLHHFPRNHLSSKLSEKPPQKILTSQKKNTFRCHRLGLTQTPERLDHQRKESLAWLLFYESKTKKN
jgi:hypothetical protein